MQKNHDNWKNKVQEMQCRTCAFYVQFRCRRNAPTIHGFPPVYPTDWCGNHRLDKTTMQQIELERTKEESDHYGKDNDFPHI